VWFYWLSCHLSGSGPVEPYPCYNTRTRSIIAKILVPQELISILLSTPVTLQYTCTSAKLKGCSGRPSRDCRRKEGRKVIQNRHAEGCFISKVPPSTFFLLYPSIA